MPACARTKHLRPSTTNFLHCNLGKIPCRLLWTTACAKQPSLGGLTRRLLTGAESSIPWIEGRATIRINNILESCHSYVRCLQAVISSPLQLCERERRKGKGSHLLNLIWGGTDGRPTTGAFKNVSLVRNRRRPKTRLRDRFRR